jgi:putative salt-induced outer membrane protein YdiY
VDRYTIKGDFERDRNNGRKTDDNWEVRSKYDRFSKSDERNYWGGKLRLEYDRFADLDLRTILGPHIGRQFLDTPRLAFHGEIGPVYVDEQFDEAEDNDFPGALWEGGATSDIVGFGSTLYLNHDGILNFDDPEDLILNTTLGLKFPLILGFEAGVQAKWEYDGGAPEDIDELDETYTFRLGYAW